MVDELDPEVFGDLPPVAPDEKPPVQEESQPLYPIVQSLGSEREIQTFLCFDPYRDGSQVVQKRISERVSHQYPDVVEHGFARLQGLVHPGLALVRDFGWEGGHAFLVREWVQGMSLSQVLPKLRPEEILGIIRQLLQVLDYLFSQNTFHLHLKPENLFVDTQSGEGPLLKVTDFGLREVIQRVTQGGRPVVVGTPPFTAPDYAAQPVPDIRADLYSVGVLCYWALSRQLPYPGQDPKKILQAQLMAEPKPLDKVVQVPEKLSQWVQSLIQPAAKNRPDHLRTVYRDFLTATAAMKLKGANHPPLIFSDPDQVFRRKTVMQILGRIVQQGQRWAIQGSVGMGTGYLARWIQRYLRAHGKRTVLYGGEEISQLSGEGLADPNDPLFVLIDYADRGPVSAWLEVKPYQHVILFGQDLAWAKKDPAWQFFNLEKLEEETLREIETETFGNISDSLHQRLLAHYQGNPARLVRMARVAVQEGGIEEKEGKWRAREDLLKLIFPLAADGPQIKPVTSLDPKMLSVLKFLSLMQTPLTVETIREWLDLDDKVLYPWLLKWTYQGFVRRRIWSGQEYFQSSIPCPAVVPQEFTEEDIQEWVLGLEVLGWYRQSKELLELYYPKDKLQRNADLILTRSRLANLIGDHQIVFQNITSTFVKDLPPEQQGPAFEILGRSLIADGKGAQAETCYKKAFAQYRATQDMAGQVQVLLDLGAWYGLVGDGERSIKYFDQALAFAKKLPEESPLLGQVFLEIGGFYARATDFIQAEDNYLKSIEQFSKHRQYHLLVKAYQDFGRLLVRQGEFQQGEFYVREALLIATFREDWVSQGVAYFLLSRIEANTGNLSRVLERLSEAIVLLERQPYHSLYGEALVLRANFYEKNRLLDKAKKDAMKILTIAESKKDWLLQAQGFLIRGKVLRRDLKRLDMALRNFQKAQEAFAKTEDIEFGWEVAYEMGETERNLGNVAEARSLYESALNQLNQYVNSLPKPAQELFLKDGKRDQIEMSLKWLR